MEARHGPALSWREQRPLTGIEQELRTDEELDVALRTMRLRKIRWPWKRRYGHQGPADPWRRA